VSENVQGISVQCQECGRRWILRPDDDLYERDSDGKKVCTKCLVGDLNVETLEADAKVSLSQIDRLDLECTRAAADAFLTSVAASIYRASGMPPTPDVAAKLAVDVLFSVITSEMRERYSPERMSGEQN
jgi:hypothetical protein